jgi:hypothetical protein
MVKAIQCQYRPPCGLYNTVKLTVKRIIDLYSSNKRTVYTNEADTTGGYNKIVVVILQLVDGANIIQNQTLLI